MREYCSLTTQRLRSVDANRVAMRRTERAFDARLRSDLRGLHVVLALWGVTLGGILLLVKL